MVGRLAAYALSEPCSDAATICEACILEARSQGQPRGKHRRGFDAVLVAVTNGAPLALTIQDGNALPSGPFELGHRSLQTGLRAWVEEQTHHPLGYVEQLYTFADRDRDESEAAQRVISISYLGLTR